MVRLAQAVVAATEARGVFFPVETNFAVPKRKDVHNAPWGALVAYDLSLVGWQVCRDPENDQGVLICCPKKDPTYDLIPTFRPDVALPCTADARDARTPHHHHRHHRPPPRPLPLPLACVGRSAALTAPRRCRMAARQ